jgi:hypothetical protein
LSALRWEDVIVPNWLRQSLWVDRGSNWARAHPLAAAWLAFVISLLIAGLAMLQGICHWHGTRSAVVIGVGALGGLFALLAGNTLRSGHGPRLPPSIYVAISLAGSLAVIPTVLFAGVSTPGVLLGVTQGLADGYLALFFLGLLFFVRVPQQSARRGVQD